MHAKLEFLRLANWRVAWLAQSGEALNPADASTIKVFGTEFYMEAARLLMEVMRDQAPLQGDSPGAVVRGRVERMLRVDAHPHVRRRHQRDAARPDRDLRAQHARQPALTSARTDEPEEPRRWTFPSTKTQEELRGLAARILEDRSGLQHLKERDRSDDWYDRATWHGVRQGEPARHRAARVGGRARLRLPRPLHGAARGRADRRAASRRSRRSSPGALPIAQFGSDAQQAVLAKVASGDVLLTAALVEAGAEPQSPTTTATRDGDGWRITGTKSNVAGATAAELVLVPASVDGRGRGVPRADERGRASRPRASRR